MTPQSSQNRSGAAVLLRNEPMQARSTARLTRLLDAAAAVVDEIGYERLTTAMVAERAGSSIGTVYRYFPDRIAVLQGLASRSLARFETEGLPRLAAVDAGSWSATIDALADYWVHAYRTEPGFRSMRFGDVLDLRPRVDADTSIGSIVASVTPLVARSPQAPDDRALRFHLEVALLVLDSLLARAFAAGGDDDGDPRMIDEATRVMHLYLDAEWGRPGA